MISVVTALTITEVAGALGFANQSHLVFHLRRLLGVSPVALRRGVSHLLSFSPQKKSKNLSETART